MLIHLGKASLTALGLTLAVAGCTGEVDGGAPGGSAGSNGMAGSPSGAGAGPQDCAAPVVPKAPLRRLTRFEYNNTVRDLAKVTDSPANMFPAEEAGSGFGTDAKVQSVSDTLAAKYVDTAKNIAASLTTPERITELAACASAPDAANEGACVGTVISTFVPRAYRRPLEAGEADGLLQLFQAVRTGGASFTSSLAAVLEAVLQTPEFLYRPELGVAVEGRADLKRPTSYEMASRLSYLFLGSMPDDALVAAAAAGSLTTAEGVKAQATRLMGEARTKEVVRFFFDNLLPIQGLTALARSKDTYPTFSGRIGGLMRQETQTFLENEVFNGGTWPAALTAPYTYVNQELATYYGIPGVTGEAFQKVPLDGVKRAGLMTQAGVVAGTIHANENNPVVRGSFVLSKLLCIKVGSPPASLGPIVPPDPALGGTTRDRYAAHSSKPACKGCHTMMDPLGFALENFNPVGLWQDTENGLTIDVSADSPQIGVFNGAVEMGKRLAESADVQACFAVNWANLAYGRPTEDQDACSMQRVQNQFKATGYNIKELLLELTQTDTFLYLPAVRE